MQSSVNHLLSELLITGFAGEPEILTVPMAAVTSKISKSSKTESKKIEIFLHCSVGDEGPKTSDSNTLSKSAPAVLKSIHNYLVYLSAISDYRQSASCIPCAAPVPPLLD